MAPPGSEKATAAAVLASLDDWLVAGTRPGDRVLFYFGGHGYYVRDLDGDEPTGFDQILAGHDVERRGEEFANTILDDDIAARLRRLEVRAQHLMMSLPILFQACFRCHFVGRRMAKVIDVPQA